MGQGSHGRLRGCRGLPRSSWRRWRRTTSLTLPLSSTSSNSSAGSCGSTTPPHHHTTTPPPPPAVSTQELPLCVACCETQLVGLMADGAGTSAWRRRQRRLRSWLRHERQTVAMELAAALHHIRDVGPVTHADLRAQKAASSGAGGGSRDALCPTGTEAASTGERPGLPLEPGPQRSDRTVRRSSGDNLPTLARSGRVGR